MFLVIVIFLMDRYLNEYKYSNPIKCFSFFLNFIQFHRYINVTTRRIIDHEVLHAY